MEKETFLESFPVAKMLLAAKKAENEADLQKESGADNSSKTQEEQTENSEDWCALYERAMQKFSGYGKLEYQEYYDISGDGVPELFLRFQPSGELRVFTIENGSVQYVALLDTHGSNVVYFDDGRVAADVVAEKASGT